MIIKPGILVRYEAEDCYAVIRVISVKHGKFWCFIEYFTNMDGVPINDHDDMIGNKYKIKEEDTRLSYLPCNRTCIVRII